MEHLFHSRLSESSGVFGRWSDVLSEDHVLLLVLLNSLALEQLLFGLIIMAEEACLRFKTRGAVLSLNALSGVRSKHDGSVLQGLQQVIGTDLPLLSGKV